MGGLLIPPWYQPEVTSDFSFGLVNFFFGFSIACAVFTATTIAHQAHRSYRRSKGLFKHPYVAMICVEWLSSVVISIISYLFINKVIPASFWLFFGILCLWSIQMQCIMQIIINRVALIIYNARRVKRLKLAVGLLVGVINISVFIVWLPARLQVNSTWIHINDVWDRVEKGIFAAVDLGLNLYFNYLVRAELVAYGLTKYRALYWFNLGMIFISISLDIIVIGIMSLPTYFMQVISQSLDLERYVQFHPLMYLIKLKIEMNMADLIVKVVKATSSEHQNPRYAVSGPQLPWLQRQGKSHNRSNRTKDSKATSLACSSRCPSQAHILPIAEPRPGELFEIKELPSPSRLDVDDVTDRRTSAVCTHTGQIDVCGEDAGELTVVPRPSRPALMRSVSELTQLEVSAGHMHEKGRKVIASIGTL